VAIFNYIFLGCAFLKLTELSMTKLNVYLREGICANKMICWCAQLSKLQKSQTGFVLIDSSITQANET
jgi:hypothetical protein